MFARPFVMQSIISSLNEPNNTIDEKGGLVGAILLTFGGVAVCQAASTHLSNRLVVRLRGGLLSQLFDKSYRLKISDAKKQAAITLMSADFAGIATGFPQCIEIPFSVIESGLGMYFLAKFIDRSCLVIFIPLIGSTIAGILFGKYLTPAVKYWNERIETRVTKTSRALSQLSAIKKLGLGPNISEFIQHLRVVETIASRKYRRIQAYSLGSVGIVDATTPVIVITAALFAGAFGNEISADVVFPILAIVLLVQVPLSTLLKAYPSAMTMLGCFERIQAFLSQAENSDPRVIVPHAGQEGTVHDTHPSAVPTTQQTMVNQDSSYFVLFADATIAPHGVSRPLLNNVSFSISEGSITAVFGGTSSGKTTLMQSMMGEAEILDGFIYLDESNMSVAYCGQIPYLPNVTIRECIVGACEHDPVWFNTVIASCKLVEDLSQLPGGENYVIGSDGLKLSGGQRQRIGIARSVYARTRAIIFDDIFSALDDTTAINILLGLCGRGGLLRQSNCTVLIASYQAECLDVADSLIFLDGNGNVSYERCQDNPAMRSQVVRLLGEASRAGSAQMESQRQAQAPPHASISTAGIQREKEMRRKGDARLYMLWIDAVGRISVFAWCSLIVLMGGADMAPPIFVRAWIAVAPSNRLWLLGYAVIAISHGFLGFLSLYYLYIELSPRAANGLHEKLTKAVTQATLGFLSSTDTGLILNRYSQDMELLSRQVPASIHSFVYCGTTSFIQIGIILSGATYMTAILPVILASIFFIQRYYLRTSRQLRLLGIESQAPLVSELRETSTGLVYIRGFGWQEQSLARSLRLLDESQKPFYFLLCSQTLLALVLDLLTTFVATVLTVVCLYAKDASTPNATGLALLGLLTANSSFRKLITFWTSMETSVGALARLRHFFEDTPTEAKKRAVKLPLNWPTQGRVQLNNVSARYVVDEQDREAPVLHDLTLTVEPGEKIGIMGRTGSGKSSLLAAILGFLRYSGTLTIDGVDVATVEPDQLRSRIITISQELVELDGTIRDNMLPYDKSWGTVEKKLDEKEREDARGRDRIIRETMERLGIWDQVESKGGLNASLEEASYSHGELQLMCIARAVVRRRLSGSMLVLVDEATASVDHGRDQIVREMMRDYFQGCTIIVVAHRAETITDAKRILRMAFGHVVGIEER
ncbi:hypothetical protein NQ176_g6018 [Zarea fungicola]|uniref:Uncharacterized protein n=1 Tax=Zarea fungicola TaxID=93591 RepID=A0ACC1N6L9_9HYPO|nr:hypothetical protein NQ176_g6018 [Lecanicillium fungicola]